MRSDAGTSCRCLVRLLQSRWVQSESTAAAAVLLSGASAETEMDVEQGQICAAI